MGPVGWPWQPGDPPAALDRSHPPEAERRQHQQRIEHLAKGRVHPHPALVAEPVTTTLAAPGPPVRVELGAHRTRHRFPLPAAGQKSELGVEAGPARLAEERWEAPPVVLQGRPLLSHPPHPYREEPPVPAPPLVTAAERAGRVGVRKGHHPRNGVGHPHGGPEPGSLQLPGGVRHPLQHRLPLRPMANRWERAAQQLEPHAGAELRPARPQPPGIPQHPDRWIHQPRPAVTAEAVHQSGEVIHVARWSDAPTQQGPPHAVHGAEVIERGEEQARVEVLLDPRAVHLPPADDPALRPGRSAGAWAEQLMVPA